jgi:putative transposase
MYSSWSATASRGLPQVVANAWPAAVVQTCIVHLIRNTFHLASTRDRDALKRDVRPVCTAVNAERGPGRARRAHREAGHPLRRDHPAAGERLDEFIPFLDYDVEIHKVICPASAIESLNARCRRAVKARGHFPAEQAALKCLYLVTRSP